MGNVARKTVGWNRRFIGRGRLIREIHDMSSLSTGFCK